MRENGLLISLIKKDFKMLLNCVMVFIYFMLAGSMLHVFIADCGNVFYSLPLFLGIEESIESRDS